MFVNVIAIAVGDLFVFLEHWHRKELDEFLVHSARLLPRVTAVLVENERQRPSLQLAQTAHERAGAMLAFGAVQNLPRVRRRCSAEMHAARNARQKRRTYNGMIPRVE